MPLDLFSKTSLPESLPSEMLTLVNDLKNSSNKEDCLKKAYQILAARYQGHRLKTYTKLCDAFRSDIDYLWSQKGFLHCNNINFLLRILLIKSNFFTESDIRIKWTLVWYVSPHQYLQVKLNDKWVDVDIWARPFGIGFGDHAHGFH